jgi:hypothetical protein
MVNVNVLGRCGLTAFFSDSVKSSGGWRRVMAMAE